MNAQTLNELASLNATQRYAIGELLMDSAQAEQGFELTAAQTQELERRLQAHLVQPKTGIAHSDLMVKMRQQLRA
jgi:putative addiction module component (TIGR02574 family)